MLGPVGAWPPSTWTPVRGDAPSPSLPTLATQVLSSFPPLLQLLPSYATVEEQTKRAIDSVHLPTKQLSVWQNKLLSVTPTFHSFPVISSAAPVSVASTPSPTSAPVFLPASASVAPNSTPASASVASM